MLQTLQGSDTLVVTELSRLGRSTAEVIALINELVSRNIHVIILKQNLDIHRHDMNSKITIALFSLFAELERDLISLRTKEALNAKRLQGITLGKPKGTIQKSKFDADLPRIKELLALLRYWPGKVSDVFFIFNIWTDLSHWRNETRERYLKV